MQHLTVSSNSLLFVTKTFPTSCVEQTHESVYGMSTDDKAATQPNGVNDLSITVHCRKFACLAHDVSCDPQHASPNCPSLPPPVVQYQSCVMLQCYVTMTNVCALQSITGMFESAQCVLLKQKYASESRIMQLRTPACLKVLGAKSS